MVNDPALRKKLRRTLERAVKLIIDTQNQQGGWRYMPVRGDADISVTICQIMALRAARNAGIAVPKSVADNCIKYVEGCQDVRNTGGFYYQQQHFGDRTGSGFARTAAGIVALYTAGKYDGENVKKGLEYLRQYEPRPGNKCGFMADPEANLHYFYGHYYAVQAMWIHGGDYWRPGYPAIRDDLVQGTYHNKHDGPGYGSWEDRNHFDTDYCTAMALIILQVPNNYLPILQR